MTTPHTYRAESDDLPCDECGNLITSPDHTCAECGFPFDSTDDHAEAAPQFCVECAETMTASLVAVTFAGYAGSRTQPPEPAEMTIRCPLVSGDVCDAYTDDSPEDGQWVATCQGNADHPSHDVTVSA